MEQVSVDAATYALLMGAMTSVAILADLVCRSGAIDRDYLVAQLEASQDIARDERRIPLAMFQLLFEMLERCPSAVL